MWVWGKLADARGWFLRIQVEGFWARGANLWAGEEEEGQEGYRIALLGGGGEARASFGEGRKGEEISTNNKK